MDLQLSIAMGNNPRTRPVIEGKVKPDGISLIHTDVHPSELFWRQFRFGDFDISEMSLSGLLMARQTPEETSAWAETRESRC